MHAGRIRSLGIELARTHPDANSLMAKGGDGIPPDRQRRAGELAAEVGSSPSALSRHLKLLLDASIVEDERIPEDARVRVFRLRPESLAGVQAYLDQLQAEWNGSSSQ